MSLAFKVTPAVLIPRPETEVLVERVIEESRGSGSINCLDVGTGSGCIPVSVISCFPGRARFDAVDISPEALDVARENSIRHALADSIDFYQSDLFSSVPQGRQFDVITANLPYISDSEYGGLMADVREYEPPVALRGGADGLELIRRFINEAGRFLKEDGRFFIEIGYNQAQQVIEHVERSGSYEDIRLYRDYSGNDRVVSGRVEGAVA